LIETITGRGPVDGTFEQFWVVSEQHVPAQYFPDVALECGEPVAEFFGFWCAPRFFPQTILLIRQVDDKRSMK
jgi:hypothetical protein